MEITCSIDIDASPEKVFYWVGDPERAMAYTSSVSSYKILHKTPDWVGTTFVEVVQDEEGKTEMHGKVIAFEPNRSMAFHLEGEYNIADVTYHLEVIESGTRLTQHANIQFKGVVRIMSLFMGSTFKKKILSQQQSEFEKLKELCEADGN
jgi:carbon monoxide dehydrogenase subunit G